jgi:hypothetical protein
MCCFSGPVEEVANTRIFARGTKEGGQIIVYSMELESAREVAMILPLPVKQPAKEDAVRFISLKEYPDFFDDMEAGFPRPNSEPSRGGPLPTPDVLAEPKLVVVEVGDFIASFVPTVADFARVDERFRLGANVWNKLPIYKDSGFAVFQLKRGKQKVHPMAFEFPRRNPEQLFFPTVHIHDGQVHPTADFQHLLYCQAEGKNLMRWRESPQPAGMFMTKLAKAPGVVEPDQHCYRSAIRGKYKNADVLV